MLDLKMIIIPTVRTMRFDSERRTRNINASKLISLELLELDVRILTLGATPQGVLHGSVDSRRDVLRTYQSSESQLSTPRMLSSGSTKLRLALHHINDDDERYSLTCAALSGEIASDVRDVLLQPFRSNKYDSLKAILIERRRLITPERVNKVISGEKIGNDIPSRFLRRLQKTAGFGTKAVVGKAVIRQAFIRQMLASIRAHLGTQPDSATLESLAVLADRALAAEEDVEESKPGVAEIKVEETTKFLLEDLSKRIKRLETVTTSERKRNKGRGRANNYAHAPAFAPNVQASGFVSNQPSQYRNAKDNARPFVPPPNAQATEFVYESNNCSNAQQNVRPFAPPPQNNVAQPTDTATAQVCYYHHTYGEKARLCSEPCSYYVTLGQREVANIALSHSQIIICRR